MRSTFSGLLGLVLLLSPAFAAAPVMQHAAAIGVVQGQSFSYHVIALGGVTSYSAQGLPSGVAIDASTGLVSGTPSDIGTYRATINAANGDGISSTTLAVSVVSPNAAPLIYALLIFDAFATADPGGTMFTCALKATGSPTSYATSDAMPAGWTFSSSGTIVGGTATPGMHLVNVNATNQYGVGSAAVTINIHPACTQLVTTTGTLNAGDRFVVTLTFNQPMSFSADAPYLEVHASDGSTRRLQYVSGNGTTTFQFAYTVSATDPAGDIALYRTIQPALDGGVSGLTDAEGLTLGASLPISGPVPASATIAATTAPTPVAATSTSTTPTTPTAPASTTPVATTSSPQPSSPASGTSTASTGATTATASATPVSSGTAATVAADSSSRLVNLSARAAVSEDPAHALIAGFVISGNAPKQVLVRAVGPSLTSFGVQNALASPALSVFDANGNAVGHATDASGSGVAAAAQATGAFALTPGGHDAAALLTLAPGAYSMQVMPNGGNGVALAEIYDADTAGAAPLLNISSRGYVAGGENALTAGFVVSGSTPKRVLIRGIGPALAAYGVSGALADPVVKLYQNGTVLAANDNWETAQAVGTANPPASAAEISAAAEAAGAFPLNAGSRDAALLVTLPPGSYSAAVGSANGATGAGMVEVYQAP